MVFFALSAEDPVICYDAKPVSKASQDIITKTFVLELPLQALVIIIIIIDVGNTHTLSLIFLNIFIYISLRPV